MASAPITGVRSVGLLLPDRMTPHAAPQSHIGPDGVGRSQLHIMSDLVCAWSEEKRGAAPQDPDVQCDTGRMGIHGINASPDAGDHGRLGVFDSVSVMDPRRGAWIQ